MQAYFCVVETSTNPLHAGDDMKSRTIVSARLEGLDMTPERFAAALAKWGDAVEQAERSRNAAIQPAAAGVRNSRRIGS